MELMLFKSWDICYNLKQRPEDEVFLLQKQPLITQVKDKLTEKGIRFLPGRETDLYLRGEYYDAGSSAAMKKICYEASVYFDESSCKVYMWDIAAFVESEPAFPEGTGADIKSGMTLYRNVKYTKTGPEGKTSDIVFNLYEIPMAVKDTARQYGWKFKIVLDRERSLLPAAVLPMNHARAIEYRNPQNFTEAFAYYRILRRNLLINQVRFTGF
jgi:hypothetical protein